MTSELLDDYEEGTFTPSYYSTGGGETVNHDLQIGKYTKIGNLVTIHILIGTDSISGGSGDLAVGGLPFPSNQTTSCDTGLTYSFLTTPTKALFTVNLSSLRFYQTQGSPNKSPWSHLAATSNDNRLYLTANYWTDS